MCAHAVKEVAVMAHHQYSMLKFAQILFQPLYGIQVQVVGRLIKQQIIRVTKQCLGQHHAHFLLTGQLPHQQIVLLLTYSQATQQGGSITFSCISTHLCKFVLQFGHLDAVLIAEVRLAVQSLALLHHLPHGGVPHKHCVEHGFLVILEVILTEYAQTFTWSQFHSSLAGLQFSADGFEQCGFSCPVCTNHAIDVAVGKLHVHVLVEDALAELNGNVA